ncbi:MAG: LysR family transcriptional regulator [Eggerthellaceae bacterium]|nr:LysR family transcriptional regulator [Eggerthellaceae bacterium]
MDDRKLEVLVAAVETGSFNKAAQRCHCSQSAVTQLMNAMEAELGCKVVERSHAGVVLTDKGKALYPAVKEAFEALAGLKSAAAELGTTRTVLHVGAYASVAKAWLPKAMVAFRESEPHIDIEVRIGSSDLADWLLEGSVDLVICDDWLFEERLARERAQDYRERGAQAGRGEFAWIPLAEDPLCAVVPARLAPKNDGAISREALFEHPYIFDSKYVYGSYLSSEFSDLIKVRTDDSDSLVSMVAGGMGVTVLPKLCLAHVPASVAVVDLDPPGKRVLGVAHAPRASGQTRAFAAFLQRTISPAGA